MINQITDNVPVDTRHDFQIKLLTASQVAEQLQLTLQRVYELARGNKVPCVRIGRQIRFDESALREWIARGGDRQNEQTQNSVAA